MSNHFAMSLGLIEDIVNTVVPNLFFKTEIDSESGVLVLYIPKLYSKKVRDLLGGAYLKVVTPSHSDYHVSKYLDIKIIEE